MPDMTQGIMDQTRSILADGQTILDDQHGNYVKLVGTGAVVGAVVSLVIVFYVMRKQPWWVKLLTFLVINPALMGISVFGLAATGVFRGQSDEAQAAQARIDQAMLNESAPPDDEPPSDVSVPELSGIIPS